VNSFLARNSIAPFWNNATKKKTKHFGGWAKAATWLSLYDLLLTTILLECWGENEYSEKANQSIQLFRLGFVNRGQGWGLARGDLSQPHAHRAVRRTFEVQRLLYAEMLQVLLNKVKVGHHNRTICIRRTGYLKEQITCFAEKTVWSFLLEYYWRKFCFTKHSKPVNSNFSRFSPLIVFFLILVSEC